MSHVAMVLRVLSATSNFRADVAAAAGAVAYFGSVADGCADDDLDVEAYLKFFAARPQLAEFVLSGNVDELIRAAVCAPSAALRRGEVIALRRAGDERPIDASAPDPVFAAINRHSAAFEAMQRVYQLEPLVKEDDFEAMMAAPIVAESTAAEALAATVPTTIDGLLTMLAHIGKHKKPGCNSAFYDLHEDVVLKSTGAAALALQS